MGRPSMDQYTRDATRCCTYPILGPRNPYNPRLLVVGLGIRKLRAEATRLGIEDEGLDLMEAWMRWIREHG